MPLQRFGELVLVAAQTRRNLPRRNRPGQGAILARSARHARIEPRAPAQQNALASPNTAPGLSENAFSRKGLNVAAIIGGDTLFELLAPGGFRVRQRRPLQRFEQHFRRSRAVVWRQRAPFVQARSATQPLSHLRFRTSAHFTSAALQGNAMSQSRRHASHRGTDSDATSGTRTPRYWRSCV